MIVLDLDCPANGKAVSTIAYECKQGYANQISSVVAKFVLRAGQRHPALNGTATGRAGFPQK